STMATPSRRMLWGVCFLLLCRQEFYPEHQIITSGFIPPSADGVRSELHIFHHSCALKKDEGPCKAIKDRFYFDIDTGRCELFEYGGCQGNANNFETLQVCEEMCLNSNAIVSSSILDKSPCHLEDEPGPCRGLVPRYYFDYKSQECKRFFYGGCFGNANNFKTIKECHKRCLRMYQQHNISLLSLAHKNMSSLQQSSVIPFNPPEFCLSPVDRGDCDGSVRRYIYNPRTERCQMFRYSGCGGNKNNFVHKRHCMKMCMKGVFSAALAYFRDHSRRKQIRIKTKNSNILFRSV
uniref:Tissue factor pathway inhibitor n=1 Tax=Sinocyclocheilus anshuiensis TaxID=1608454 RepID=A0A671T667_9TELE